MIRSGGRWGFVLRGIERGGVVYRRFWWRGWWWMALETRVACFPMKEVMMHHHFVGVAL